MARTAAGISDAGAVAHQSAGLNGLAPPVACGQRVAIRERDEVPMSVEVKWAGANKQRPSSGLDDRREGGIEFAFIDGSHDQDLPPESTCRRFYGAQIGLRLQDVRVHQRSDNRRLWNQLMQQFKPLRLQSSTVKAYAGNVAARPIQAGDVAVFYRISPSDKDNGYRCGRGFRRHQDQGRIADNHHGHPTTDQISRHRRQSIGLILRPVEFDRHVAALNESSLAQALAKPQNAVGASSCCRAVEISDKGQRPLRAGRKRPCRSRSGKKGDEFAPPHSITSSARRRTTSGTWRPSAFAVFMLSTVSYLVGACTGRSAGFSPLRMRST